MQGGESLRGAPTREASPRKVAVFDDDAFLLGLTERVLLTAGYEVRAANHLERVAESVTDFQPELVLMDVDFRGRDEGVDAVSRLRPITGRGTCWVLYSASPPEELARHAAACGADSWIRKDGDVAHLVARVAELLPSAVTA